MFDLTLEIRESVLTSTDADCQSSIEESVGNDANGAGDVASTQLETSSPTLSFKFSIYHTEGDVTNNKPMSRTPRRARASDATSPVCLSPIKSVAIHGSSAESSPELSSIASPKASSSTTLADERTCRKRLGPTTSTSGSHAKRRRGAAAGGDPYSTPRMDAKSMELGDEMLSLDQKHLLPMDDEQLQVSKVVTLKCVYIEMYMQRTVDNAQVVLERRLGKQRRATLLVRRFPTFIYRLSCPLPSSPGRGRGASWSDRRSLIVLRRRCHPVRSKSLSSFLDHVTS